MGSDSEIERKFLVSSQPDGLVGRAGEQIEQGYLAISDGVEVRLRRAGDATRLTVKRGEGEVRDEIEFGLEPRVFESLWSLTEGRRLRKIRRRVPLEGYLIAEVDSFEAELDGLILVEVEFGSEAAEHAFDPPAWFGEELTGDQRYAGQSLAAKGMPASGRQSGDTSYRLKRRESVAEGTRRTACGRVEKALGRLEVGDDDYEAAIHGVRKDLKKLRAVLRLVREGLGEDFYRTQNKRFRDAGRLLSDVRDAQVKLATLEALEDRYGDEIPEQSSSLWLGMLEGERRKLAESATDDAASRAREAKRAIAEGAEELADWPVDGHGWRLVEAGITRSYREARKAMERAGSSGNAEDVHEWRKRTKDLWYHLRLLRGTWKPVIGEFADQAHELGELLGDHHDLTVLADDLDGRGRIRDGDAIRSLIARRQRELLKEAKKLGARLFAEKPKAFRRRLHRYWRAWR